MVVPPLAWPDGPEDSIRFCLVGDRPQLHQESIHPPVSTVDHGLGWAGNTPFSLTSPIRLSVCFIGREGGRHFVDRCPNFLSAAIPYSLPPLPSKHSTAQQEPPPPFSFPPSLQFNSYGTATGSPQQQNAANLHPQACDSSAALHQDAAGGRILCKDPW